jgi:hypothetical protein
VEENNRALANALRYSNLGLAVVPVPPLSKECHVSGWQRARLDNDQLAQCFADPDSNIAAAFGALSGHVVCVDCDWPEAARLARHLLPRTAMWGRESDPASHFLIKSKVETTRHKAPSNVVGRRRCIIEILSTDHLCLLPGSTHPSGEPIRFEVAHKLSTCPVAEMEPATLRRWVSRIAGGALLAYHWSEFDGSRHDLTLALAGSCLHAGWSPEDVAVFFTAFFEIADDPEEKDRIGCVKSTLTRFLADESVAGWPTAAAILNDLAPFIANTLELDRDVLADLIIRDRPLAKIVPVDAAWPELLPFDRLEHSAADYPLSALGALSPVVACVADLQQVPIALAAQSVLAGLSTAAQGLYDVAVDFHFRCPLSLWMILVAVPGERKSTTDALVFAAHRHWQTARVQRYQLDFEEYSATPKAERHARPRMPILLPSTGTTEGLVKALSDNWPSAGFTNNDAGDFLHGYSMREGRASATLSVFSRLWDGASDIAVKAGADPQILFGRRLSLSLMVQPAVVTRMLENDFGGQGFNSRCLLAYPPSTIGTRKLKVTAEAPAEVVRYHQRMRQLLDTPLVIDPATGAVTATALTLEPAAFAEYERCFNRLELALAVGGSNRDILEIANKAATNLLRLAGNLAVYEGRAVLTAQDIYNADQLVHFYLEEWRAITGKVDAVEPGSQQARRLLDWLIEHVRDHPGPFKLARVYQSGPRGCGRNADAAKKLLTELQRRGYVRAVTGNQYELRPGELL